MKRYNHTITDRIKAWAEVTAMLACVGVGFMSYMYFMLWLGSRV